MHVSYRSQERVTVIDSGIKQTDVWGIRHGRDHAGRKVINPLVLFRRAHLGEEVCRHLWQTEFGYHAEDVY